MVLPMSYLLCASRTSRVSPAPRAWSALDERTTNPSRSSLLRRPAAAVHAWLEVLILGVLARTSPWLLRREIAPVASGFPVGRRRWRMGAGTWGGSTAAAAAGLRRRGVVPTRRSARGRRRSLLEGPPLRTRQVRQGSRSKGRSRRPT